MKPPEVIYQAICAAPQVGHAVKDLKASELAALIVWLRGRRVISGVPGLILAAAEEEAASRFTLNETHLTC